jgi:hypothetical protein
MERRERRVYEQKVRLSEEELDAVRTVRREHNLESDAHALRWCVQRVRDLSRGAARKRRQREQRQPGPAAGLPVAK